MPTYDMTGTVKLVMEQQTFESGFTKREFVVTTEDDRYPQEIKFECVKDKVSLLDNVQSGQLVKVTFDLRGNEYNDRYYVNLTAWRVESAGDSGGAAEGAATSDGPALDERQPPGEEILDAPF